MRIVSVDHGSARAGLAICDPTETVVRPLDVVEPPDPAEVARVVSGHEAELVVVGLPVSLDGAEGAQAAVAREFRDSLAKVLDIPVETYDERLTTRLAEGSRLAGALAEPDALAAAHLLEVYLASRGSGPAAPGEAAGRG